MSAKLQAQPIPMSRPFPASVLWAVLAILLAAAVAVGAYGLVRSSDDTVAGTGSAGITSDRPGASVSDTSLVKGGLQPVPFSSVGAGEADIAGPGHSPQQR